MLFFEIWRKQSNFLTGQRPHLTLTPSCQNCPRYTVAAGAQLSFRILHQSMLILEGICVPAGRAYILVHTLAVEC